jgi:type VI secretion system protein ImpJ
MSLLHKVIWSEGMFLHPHHFQQQEQYFERLMVTRSAMMDANLWGITDLKIDDALLLSGKFAIRSCSGIFPDGTPFTIPARDAAPPPIDIPIGLTNVKVFLAVALERPGMANTSLAVGHENGAMPLRYQVETVETRDHNAGSELWVPVQQGKLVLRLLREDEDRQGFSCLPLALIAESKSDHRALLNHHYFPTYLSVHASPILTSFLEELVSLVSYRGSSLTQRLTRSGHGGVAEITDFLLLQIMNRFEPLLTHLAHAKNLHPQQLYSVLIQLAGELATFTSAERRPTQLPPYTHEDFSATFAPLMAAIRSALSVVLEENAVALPLEEQEPNLWVSTLADKNLLDKSTFVLAVYTHTPADAVFNQFPSQTKIAPLEEIRNLVNRALPGIELTALPVAPRQIPYHASFVYFSLNYHSTLWQALKKSAGLAFHIGGSFPGLRLELWAIKEKRYE